MHTPRHFFPEQGGHVGEHGSLDVIQSRSPLILSGAGVPRRGYVDGFARLVDVGPTLAFLAGVPAMDLVDAEGVALDGRVLRELPRARGGQAPARDRDALGRRAVRGPAAPRRDRRAARGRPAGPARAGAARWRGGGVPVDHPHQPHRDPHRHRAGPARRDGQRLLRPGDRRAGGAQRPVDLAPQRRLAAARRAHDLRDGRQAHAGGPGADGERQRGDRPRGRLLDHVADPRLRRERRRRPRPRAARPDHLAVPAQPGVPGGRLLPLGRARRRPGAHPDARALSRPRRGRPC